MLVMVKQSKYNVWVNHGGWNFVYNGLSGGLVRLSFEETEHYCLNVRLVQTVYIWIRNSRKI